MRLNQYVKLLASSFEREYLNAGGFRNVLQQAISSNVTLLRFSYTLGGLMIRNCPPEIAAADP